MAPNRGSLDHRTYCSWTWIMKLNLVAWASQQVAYIRRCSPKSMQNYCSSSGGAGPFPCWWSLSLPAAAASQTGHGGRRLMMKAGGVTGIVGQTPCCCWFGARQPGKHHHRDNKMGRLMDQIIGLNSQHKVSVLPHQPAYKSEAVNKSNGLERRSKTERTSLYAN